MKTALITGASGGIGSAVAKKLADSGYALALLYNKNVDAASRLRDEIRHSGCDAEIFKADIASSSEVGAAVDAAMREFGHIDVLVNNAGTAEQKLFTDISDSDWNRMISTNLSGVFYTCRAVLPGMISKKRGRIINITSMWGEVGASCEVHYSAAKAGVIGLTKALAKELGPSGITVNAVSPGVIKTSMLSDFTEDDLSALADETPLGRLGTPGDVAEAVAFLASDDAAFITGQILGVNGGFVI